MRAAFYAPMKPADDPVPSGDRTFAQLILRALETGGHDTRVASRLKTWRAVPEDLPEAHAAAQGEAERIIGDWEAEGWRPEVWVTYHLYHKAPDWIGPAVADHFAIPYVVLEASRAPKRQTGPWAYGFAAADAALQRADAVGAIHRADAGCLEPALPPDVLHLFPPFLDATPFLKARPALSEEGPVRLLAVGMMRPGDKEASYRVLAEALVLLMDLDWELTLVGGGPSREVLTPLFPATRCHFAGALPPEALPQQYLSHDVFVWPAIREAFGFVFLEAQASGLPVAGGATFGVPDIVEDGRTGLLSPEGDSAALAASLRRLILNRGLRSAMGGAARAHILSRHDLTAGAARLDALLHAAQKHYLGVRTRP
ncbi:glycosyltransferase family 4 protein [Pannonibacter indicus]|uniref:Glycosyltransferase involved in cell wall bisynthesis n=1 Tax=Pannonibacter indicus TaxID=466044 RepID=A0A0K6HZD8_9HYPH|nr:glycosyltransferase family 4 protein [Pannonibacter indicus]CUA96181.1 Glycosyltransferase involved in cell wall bisynthesis [Pannonibacter indicus]